MATTPNRNYRIPDPADAIHPAVRDSLMDVDADVNSLSGGVAAALADPGGNGIVVRTALAVTINRTLANASAGLTWTNGDGVAGNPTPVLANDLAALEALTGTGFPKRTGVDTWSLGALVSGDIPDLSGIYQPLDNDLTAIAALAGTSGLPRKTGTDTWTLDTNTYATQAYADALVIGLLDDRGNFDASLNTFPASGGSGAAGAILKGDLWTISVAGTLGGHAVTAGDVVRALVDTPGQTDANWAIGEHNFGYVALNQALADGKIYVGNASGVGTAVTPSGDVTISNAGVTAIGALKVTNAMLAGSIDYSKLAAMSSANLRSILSDENGTGAALFDGATSPTFVSTLKVYSTAQSGLVLFNAANTNGFLLGRSFSSDDAQNFFIYDTAAPANRFNIGSSGQVGFGGNIVDPAGLTGANMILDSSGNLTLVSGSLFLPSTGVINFASGDVTITHSANALAFAGASSGYSFMDGNVGIGTMSPGNILDVKGVGLGSGILGQLSLTSSVAYNAGPQAGIHFVLNTTASGDPAPLGAIAVTKENATSANYASSMSLLTKTAAGAYTESMHIDSVGNIGIGTTGPNKKLEVNTVHDVNIDDEVRIGSYYLDNFYGLGMNYRIDGVGATSQHLVTYNGGTKTTNISMLTNGNVGINTTNPGEKLEVAGNIFANASTANLYLKDTSTGFQSALTTVVQLQANNRFQSAGYASQTTGFGLNSADGSGDFRYLFTDELRAKLFTADLESVLAGSQRVTKSYSTISQTFTAPPPAEPAVAIATSSLANPTVITTSAAHELTTGDSITISGHIGSTPDINGTHVVTVLTPTTFSIPVNVTVGGTGGTSTLLASTTLWVADSPTFGDAAVFVSGDTVVIRSMTRTAFGPFTISDCVGVVTGYVDGTGANAGQQSWTFTRNSGGNAGTMAGGTTVAVNQLVQDLGISGNGYVETSAVDGAGGVNAPYTQIVTWATAPVAANLTVRARLGNLKGITGTAEYGLIAGTYSATNGQFFRASDQNFDLHGINFSMWDGASEVIKFDRSAPSFALGSPLPSAYGTGTGVWMGKDTLYKFRAGIPGGNGVFWDGAVLTWKAANTTLDASGNLTATSATLSGSITATSGSIGSFTIGTYLYSGSKTAYNDGLAGVHIGSDGIGLGSTFTVSAAGALTATSGTIGGFTIGATSLLAGTGATTVAMDSGGTNPAFYAGSATPGSAPFRVTNAGALTATNATITGAVTMSSGSITGPLTMSGASGSIAIGTTPPTSATVGTGLWLDRTGLYGLASSVQQAKFDAATGAITAGAGAVTLDVNGLHFEGGLSAFNQIRWLQAAATIVALSAYNTGTDTSAGFYALGKNATDDVSIGLTAYEGNSTANDNLSFGLQYDSTPFAFATLGTTNASRFRGLIIGGGGTVLSVAPTSALDVYHIDATTNTVSDVLVVRHNSSGIPAQFFGGGINFKLESSTTENRDAVRLAAYWDVATDASRTSFFDVQTVNNAGSLTSTARFFGNGAASIGSTTDPGANNLLVGGVVKAGSGITTLTDSAGKILSAALNTVAVANGGTGRTTAWTSGENVLASLFTLNGANGTYQDTGLAVTLPEAGTYIVTADVRVGVDSGSGTNWYTVAKLYNSTDAANVANSETMLVSSFSSLAISYRGPTVSITKVITVAASKTIKLYAFRSTDGTFAYSAIESDANGRTRMTYRQIA